MEEETANQNGDQEAKASDADPPWRGTSGLLNEAGLTANALALALRVPANRIGGILDGQRGVTGDTARYFGTSAQMWINLQAKYELAIAEDALGRQIEREVLPRPAA